MGSVVVVAIILSGTAAASESECSRECYSPAWDAQAPKVDAVNKVLSANGRHLKRRVDIPGSGRN